MVQHLLGDECVQASHDIYQRGSGFDHVRWDEVKHETEQWQLLLQLDSDDTLDVIYGDARRLYWAMRATDPARH
jgi:hypothetical protein